MTTKISAPDATYLPAVQKSYDINKWLVQRCARFPRSFKFTLGDRIQTTALDLNLALVETVHAQAKDRPLHRANRLLDQLRILLRLARDVDLLTARQFEFASALNEELGRMIGGWIRHAREKGRGPSRERSLEARS